MRRVSVGVLLTVAVVVTAGVWCRRAEPVPDPHDQGARAPRAYSAAEARRELATAGVEGTVVNERGAWIGGARVCVDVEQGDFPRARARLGPWCVVADARGAFAIANLAPARYRLAASARGHVPSAPRDDRAFRLGPGEQRAGIEIVLASGGVEIVGTVSDLGGGPIARARVTARAVQGAWIVDTETDATGSFTLWVAPGSVRIGASADGYAASSESLTVHERVRSRVALVLFPASSIAGVVLGVDGRPVPDARVEADGYETNTDENGAFELDELLPGRYEVIAIAGAAIGRTARNVDVGLAQRVDGITVRLASAFRITGRVQIAGTTDTCDHGGVRLISYPRPTRTLRDSGDGTLVADGILPGRYSINVSCRGYAERTYEPIEVVDRDVLDVVWEVDRGATVRGRVSDKQGRPVHGADVSISGRSTDPLRYTHGRTTTDLEGRYAITGILAGSGYDLEASDWRGASAKIKVEVEADAVVERDLVVEGGGGEIVGRLTDDTGTPLAGVEIGANFYRPASTTDDAGAFVIAPVRPDTHELYAWMRGERLRGRDGRELLATVKVDSQPTQVELVVERRTHQIRGTVTDAAGPVGDALVTVRLAPTSEHKDTAWSAPVATTADGSFVIPDRPPGAHIIRAYRRDVEAMERVDAGSTVTLRLVDGASISGVVRRPDGTPVDPVHVHAWYSDQRYYRRETFAGGTGRYQLRGLPAGKLRLHFEPLAGAIGEHYVETMLSAGEVKVGLDVEITHALTVVGRVAELGTNVPLPGIRMQSLEGYYVPDERGSITDANGRFVVRNVAPRSAVAVYGDTDEFRVYAQRPWPRGEIFDIGTVYVRRRVPESRQGRLGFTVKVDDTKLRVIAMDSAASASGLVIGDTIVSVDGAEVGVDPWEAIHWMTGVPGTRLALGLARGVTVYVTLAAP